MPAPERFDGNVRRSAGVGSGPLAGDFKPPPDGAARAAEEVWVVWVAGARPATMSTSPRNHLSGDRPTRPDAALRPRTGQWGNAAP